MEFLLLGVCLGLLFYSNRQLKKARELAQQVTACALELQDTAQEIKNALVRQTISSGIEDILKKHKFNEQ